MAGIFKNLDASDIRLTPFRAYKRYYGTTTGGTAYSRYYAKLNISVKDGLEDIGNVPYYGEESIVLTTNSASANSVWHSIDSQFFRFYYENPKASFGQLDHRKQPRRLHKEAYVISIPQSNFGEEIEATSVSLTTIDGDVLSDDRYSNLIVGKSSAIPVPGENIMFQLNPTRYTKFYNKVLADTYAYGTELYQADVNLINTKPTSSAEGTNIPYALIRTRLLIDSASYNTSSVVINPHGTDVNKLFNFQNKDYTISLSYYLKQVTAGSTCVLLEKKATEEVIQVDIDGNTHFQKVVRYPYRLLYNSASNQIVFQKSDGLTTLTHTTAFAGTGYANQRAALTLTRSGSTYTIRHTANSGVESSSFTDTLYSRERYCTNAAPIYIGADEFGKSGSVGLLDNVCFYNIAFSNTSHSTLFQSPEGWNSPEKTYGIVARKQGMLILTDPYFVAQLGDPPTSVEYRGTTTIYENEISCTVGAGEFGTSYNHTAHQYDPDIDQYRMADFATGSDFKPFVTKVGLYNDNNELVVVGTISQPIQLPKNVDTTFILRYDL